MRAARIGSLLLALGLAVGAAAGVGLLVGFEPARLPRALLNVAAYKLTFLAAAGLLAAGAITLRRGRAMSASATAAGPAAGDIKELSEGRSVPVAFGEARQPERTRNAPATSSEDGL